VRHSKTLARIRSGKVVRMCSLGHFIPAYIKHAAAANFDCIWLDLEHRNLSDQQVQALIAFGHLFDIDIMVRPSTTDRARLYRYLEDGAAGLMVPHVSTVQQAAELVAATKFPPVGNRGLDGAGLDGDFYHNSRDDYVAHALRETFLVVQIETLQALEQVDGIAALDGIDGLFVGPGDLGLRIDQAGDVETLDKGIERVGAAAAKHGKAWGLPVPSLDELRRQAARGAQILAHGGDFRGFMAILQDCGRDFAALDGDDS